MTFIVVCLHLIIWEPLKQLNGVTIACLRPGGKIEVVIELLKPERRKSEKISVLSLIIFVGMHVSWLAFVESKLKISFKISSLSTCEKEKREHCFLLHTSPILSMLGWLQYFTMNLLTGLLMLSEIGSQLAYSAIFRLLTILEKKVFWICAVLISLSMIWFDLLQKKVTFSLDTILLDKNSLMVFKKGLLSVTFYLLLSVTFHQDYYNITFWIF